MAKGKKKVEATKQDEPLANAPDGQPWIQTEESPSGEAQPSTPVLPVPANVAPAVVAPVETKAERFKRLAVRRMNVVVAKLRHVENLANRMNYEYTAEQAAAINDALQASVARIKTAFAGNKKEASGFTF